MASGCHAGALDDGARVDRFHWLSHVIKHSNAIKSIYSRTIPQEIQRRDQGAEKKRDRVGNVAQ